MINTNPVLHDIVDVLNYVRDTKPLVDVITNRVTINDCANILLALGGSPIMSEEKREAKEIVSISNGLVLNLGLLSKPAISTMLSASKHAKKNSIPVIFDPVGAGASKLRNRLCETILRHGKPDVIRGNFSEIKAIAGINIESRGVDVSFHDSIRPDNLFQCAKIVQNLATKYHCVVCATGEIDIIADEKNVYACKNGHEMLCDITGTGCMLSALLGATCSNGKFLEGTLAAVTFMGLAGEKAALFCRENRKGIGTFRTHLIDAIYQMDAHTILTEGAVEHVESLCSLSGN